MKKRLSKEKNKRFFYPSFFPKTRQGLSDVVTALILIGISIIAIGLVWIVVSNLISSGSEQIDIDTFTISLEVSRAVSTANGLDVTIERNPGGGDISNIALVVSDGVIKQTFLLNQTIDELQQKTFSLNYLGLVKTVEVVPFFSRSSGDSISGSVADTLELSSSQTVKNIPWLVSWYRFEGSADDEMGLNDGNIFGSPPLVDGKYGKAYRFTVTSDGIAVNDAIPLRLENSNVTIVTWVNKSVSGSLGPLLVKGDYLYSGETGYSLGLQGVAGSKVRIAFGTDTFSENNGGNFSNKKWTHVAASQIVNAPARTIKSYVNGELSKITTNNNVLATSSSGYNVVIGINHEINSLESFQGIIDEVMIFNKTLSDQDISALYNLDLS